MFVPLEDQALVRTSLPSRERGLKLLPRYLLIFVYFVAPFAGAWIEIDGQYSIFTNKKGRSLRGSVD